MAIRPQTNTDLTTGQAPLFIRVAGTVVVIVIGFMILKWIAGVIFKLVLLGLVIAAAVFLVQSLTKKS